MAIASSSAFSFASFALALAFAFALAFARALAFALAAAFAFALALASVALRVRFMPTMPRSALNLFWTGMALYSLCKLDGKNFLAILFRSASGIVAHARCVWMPSDVTRATRPLFRNE